MVLVQVNTECTIRVTVLRVLKNDNLEHDHDPTVQSVVSSCHSYSLKAFIFIIMIT